MLKRYQTHKNPVGRIDTLNTIFFNFTYCQEQVWPGFCFIFQLYLETGDPHVNIIIVDFSSTDIDVSAALNRSQLKR